MTTETFWLIERGPNQGHPQHEWWNDSRDGAVCGWKSSVHDATRFITKAEAERVKRGNFGLDSDLCAVTSHSFLAALASAPAGAGEGASLPVSPELDATMLWLGETRDSLRAMADRANQLLTAHCRAALAGEPAVAAARPPKMPDEAIREWGDRYDLRMTITEMRSAFEDAQTLHLSEPAVAADEGRPYDALLGYLEAQKFHPSASHVPPDFRDGYNRALQTVIERVQGEQRMAASQDEQQEKQG